MGYTQAEFFTMFFALFVILILGVIFKFTLRKAPLSVRQMPINVLGAIILILELVKQGYHLIAGDWGTWYIPLHFCSFFLVWYAVALFTHGKIRQLMYFCSIVGGFLVSVLMFIAPRMILHDAAHDVWGSFNHFHTFFYHMGVIAYWVWLLMLDVFKPERSQIRSAVMIYTGFYFVVITGAFIFQENYTNVLRSDIGLLESLRMSAGQFTYDILLLAIGVAAIAIISTTTYFVMSKWQNYRQKNALQLEENQIEQNS
ncbi:MAG: YwaF family protein [Clostridia bacterium]|nr:YwaF family protein [Clostridia bacterium]